MQWLLSSTPSLSPIPLSTSTCIINAPLTNPYLHWFSKRHRAVQVQQLRCIWSGTTGDAMASRSLGCQLVPLSENSWVECRLPPESSSLQALATPGVWRANRPEKFGFLCPKPTLPHHSPRGVLRSKVSKAPNLHLNFKTTTICASSDLRMWILLATHSEMNHTQQPEPPVAFVI